MDNNTLIIIDSKDKYLLDIHHIVYAEMNFVLVEKEVKKFSLGNDENKAYIDQKTNNDKHLYNFKSSKTKWRYIFLIHFVSILFLSTIYIDQKTPFLKKYFEGNERSREIMLNYDNDSEENSVNIKPKRNLKDVVILNPINVGEDSTKTDIDSFLISSKSQISIMNKDSIKK